METRRRRKQSSLLFAADELPPCEGPKLRAFEYRNLPIQWLERLDEDRSDDSGIQGAVFKARIMSKDYAVKVVSTSDTAISRQN
jgi:hypothetical protein